MGSGEVSIIKNIKKFNNSEKGAGSGENSNQIRTNISEKSDKS